ncbi:DoxX family protein [Rhizobium sp. CRIBSB]|nr:DoxX family protein [Rhizobium sp. CRIBSB]
MNTRTLSARQRQHAGYLNLTLWTLQGWIAMFFVAAGYAKVSEPMSNLVELMHWPAMVSENLVRGLGMAEIVLALLVLAPLVSWKAGRPLLVVAAAGLIVLQTAMFGVHLVGLDIGLALTNLVLLAMTAPVLAFRWRERR